MNNCAIVSGSIQSYLTKCFQTNSQQFWSDNKKTILHCHALFRLSTSFWVINYFKQLAKYMKDSTFFLLFRAVCIQILTWIEAAAHMHLYSGNNKHQKFVANLTVVEILENRFLSLLHLFLKCWIVRNFKILTSRILPHCVALFFILAFPTVSAPFHSLWTILICSIWMCACVTMNFIFVMCLHLCGCFRNPNEYSNSSIVIHRKLNFRLHNQSVSTRIIYTQTNNQTVHIDGSLVHIKNGFSFSMEYG